MTIVMVCWVLAMVSGLSWAKWWTGTFTLITLIVFLWVHALSLTAWTGWVQLVAFGLTPWLLAAQRARHEATLKALHADEQVQLMRLSEAARSLLSLQTSVQQLERQFGEITNVYHVTKETSGALHLPELFAASLELAPQLMSVRGLRLIDLSAESPHILRATRASDGSLVAGETIPPPAASPDRSESIVGRQAATAAYGPSGQAAGGGTNHVLELEQTIIQRVMASGRPASLGGPELAGLLPEGVSRLAWAPLWREQKPIGVLVADDLPEEQLKMLALVANQLSLQLSRIHLYEQVEALAVTDALTGLWVRRYFLERAREELIRSQRHELPATLLMVDLDFFKQKNDTFGHLVGDVVLRDVARLLQRNLREVDLIARFGGEEFVLLLIETGLEQAMPIAQRLRQLVEVHPIRAYDELLSQTVSIGLAAFPDHARTLEGLIECADQALYAAKRAGRNRIICWSERLEVQHESAQGSGLRAQGDRPQPSAPSPEPTR